MQLFVPVDTGLCEIPPPGLWTLITKAFLGGKMKKYLALVFVLVLGIATGCGKKVPIHTGAVSNLDSYAYDLLLVEQSAIKSARADFAAGNLPAEAKAPLNAAIAQYNTTQAAWQTYHASGGDGTKLQEALNSLVSAVAEVQKLLGKAPAPIV